MKSLPQPSVKLPPFWPADRRFGLPTVYDKGHHCAENQVRPRVRHGSDRDLILTPPDANPYDTLKQHLTHQTAASEQRRLQRLITTEELGDRKATQLLRRMQQLLEDKASAVDSSFLRGLFLQRLPTNVRVVLASAPESTTLEDLAQLADEVNELPAPMVFSVTTSKLTSELEQLRAEVSSLLKDSNRLRPHQTGGVALATARPDDQPAPLP